MFFFNNGLNQKSRQMVRNIWWNAKNHPMYAQYDIEMNETQYADAGAIAINITKQGFPVNLFLFYPDESNNGNIGSVAIYGSGLSGHKQAIESSMTLFGLPVESVDWDEGMERFLDVTLKEY